ncbi:MAG: NTP transferase domain-containing protein [Cellulomonadaceae bacterium]|jgi:molybdopterin-guanine dinucleotide biosynthesis protein A|nr:NTP transferase domain-containing protein [Cellulomonadaceae bacterium]
MTPRCDALILAGGRAERLGVASKADVTVDGVSLLTRVLGAVTCAERVVVVGRTADVLPPGVILTCEDPPFGGPVAGIEAGLEALERAGGPHDAPDCVLLLAVDIPGAAGAVEPLLAEYGAASSSGTIPDGVCLFRDDHPQWLCAAYRKESLTAALGRVRADRGTTRNQSVRRLMDGVTLVHLDDGDTRASDDVDTWQDHARIEALIARQ